MKARILVCWLALAALATPLDAQTPFADFEIVETFPVETSLDHPELRDTADVWLEMIGRAEMTLDIEQFYLSNEPGTRMAEVVDAIKAAAGRGVIVRFVADSKFYKNYPETLDELDRLDNIEVRRLDMAAVHGDGVQHSKFFIVDGGEVYVGSANFDWRALAHIQEIGVRFRHRQAAAVFNDLFDLDWRLCKVDNPKDARIAVRDRKYPVPFDVDTNGSGTVRFTPVWSPAELSPNPDMWSLPALLRAVDAATSSVEIQLLTYSPVNRQGGYWHELDSALRRATTRGVEVRLMAADWSARSPKIEHLKSLACLPNVEVRLTAIPEAKDGFIPFARVCHAKYLVVDGKTCWVGGANWQEGYFYRSRDVGLLIEGRPVAETLSRVFHNTWKSEYAVKVRPEVDYAAPKIAP